MNITNRIFTTRDNSRLMCAVWDNVTSPIGIVQIIHGIFENMSAYDKLATFLNRHGYIVFGVDSVINRPTRTFENTIAQEYDIMRCLITKYNLPIFLIGFGYGGYVAQSVLRKSDIPINAICLVKSAMHNRLVIRIARALAQLGIKIYGPEAQVSIINLFKRCHCGHTQKSPICTYGFCKSLCDGLINLDSDSKCKNPILIISNATEYDNASSRFSRALYNAYHNNDLLNTTLLIYPDMQNTLLMEMNCGRIQYDILSFFNNTIAQRD